MGTIAIGRRLLLILFAALCILAPAATVAQGTPGATPQASPVPDGDGCDGLAGYFAQLAALTRDNEGLVLMRGTGFDALALSAADAATVAESITELIPRLEALSPPAPAARYHGVYLEVMAWYRDLATYRDEASHQRLINNDRRLFSIMGLAIQSGQAACGYDAWNDAYEAAFPPGD